VDRLNKTTLLNRIFIVKQTQAIIYIYIGGPFEKFVDWRQCAAVVQREA
jgi:hypothetical protein